MKANKIIAALIIIFALAVTALILSRGREESAPPTRTSVLETKIDSQGEVTVSITPLDFFGSEQAWRFKVALDTHSVELIDDLVKNATLTVDGKAENQPLGWEGDGPGGHHRQGNLLFGPVKSDTENITLELKNIGNVLSRRFQWSLKK